MSTKKITTEDVEVVWKDKRTDFFPIRYGYTLWGYTVYADGDSGRAKMENSAHC